MPTTPSQPSIRLGTVQDAAAMSAILSHYVETSIVTSIPTPLASRIEHKIETLQAFGAPFGVMTDSKDTMIGYAYGAPYRPKKGYNSSVELSIYGPKPHRSGPWFDVTALAG